MKSARFTGTTYCLCIAEAICSGCDSEGGVKRGGGLSQTDFKVKVARRAMACRLDVWVWLVQRTEPRNLNAERVSQQHEHNLVRDSWENDSRNTLSSANMAAEVSSSSIPSRSPSPVSRPPVASTPGPRATALQKLYSDAIAHVLKTCNYTNFSSCFPTPAHHVPISLKMLHEQFTDKLDESMRKEFDAILDDRHAVSSLNELDGLIEDARRRKGKAEESDVAPTP